MLLDGTYHWMLNRGIALQDEDGKTYRLAGSQTDITDLGLRSAAVITFTTR